MNARITPTETDAEEMKTKHEADKKCRGEILSELRKRLVERGVVSKREQV